MLDWRLPIYYVPGLTVPEVFISTAYSVPYKKNWSQNVQVTLTVDAWADNFEFELWV